MELIKNNFTGKTPLWQVFWVQNILLGGLLQLLVDALAPQLSTISTIVLLSIVVSYGIWVMVGMWQCAFNARWKIWGYLIRGLYIAILVIVVVTYLRNL
ncbi:hypothetical protein FE810_13790 [Thalassotalea litorea]|uniref:Uncharacterized protein n=1 Tax=Thalassotalea litorea TaxID=2020715 RepID=A0A5R9IEU0_9GAMM|nr:hypothetical protein [Thalassotalea litorea]TLU61883.1 hypothetical protein FE810_13790 [Thalassotalea litorea]